MKSVVIIPARYKSSRFTGKPLIPLLGKPMILWVAELSAKAVGQENVFVATEDSRIFDLIVSAGFNAVMTSEKALTVSSCLAWASSTLSSSLSAASLSEIS